MATGSELSIGLRIKAYLDEALAAVVKLRAEMKGLASDSDQTGKQLDSTGASAGKALTPAAAGGAGVDAGQVTATTAAIDAQTAAMARSAAASEDVARRYSVQAAEGVRLAMAQEAQAAADVTTAKTAAQAASARDKDREAVAKLLATLDPTEKALARFDAVQQRLNESLKRGSIDQETYNRVLEQARAKYVQVGTEGASAMEKLGLGTVGARRELIVIGHEVISGNFSRIPGSMMVLAERTNVLKLATQLLINPYTLLIGTVAALGAALVSAEHDQHAFQLALQSTGNFADLTRSQVDALAKQASQGGAITETSARQIATSMIATGRLGGETIGLLTQTVASFAKVTGQDVEKATDQLVRLFEDPKRGAHELDQAYHFLQPTQIAAIARLVEQGETEKAQLVLAQEFFGYMGGMAVQNMSQLDKAIASVKGSLSGFWEDMKGFIGGAGSPKFDAFINKMKLERMGTINGLLSEGRLSGKDADAARAELQVLQASVEKYQAAQDAAEKTQKAKAEETREQVQLNRAAEAYNRIVEKNKTTEEKRLKEIKDLDAAFALGILGATDSPEAKAEYDKQLKRINDTHKSHSNFGNISADARVAVAKLQEDLKLLQVSLKTSDAVIVQAVKDGNVSIDGAYQARLAILQNDTDQQRTVLQAQLADIDGALKKAKTPAERAPLAERRIRVETELKVLDSSLSEASNRLKLWKKEQERELATVEAKLRVSVADLRGSFDAQAVRRQLELQFKPELDAINRDGSPQEREAGQQRIQLLIDAGVAQAQFNAKLAESQRLQAQLATQEGAIQAQQQQGLISQTEAEARIRALRAQQVPVLLEIVDQLQQIRDALPADAKVPFDEMGAAIGRLRNQATSDTPVIVSAGTRIRNSLIDGLADAAATAVTDFKNLRQAIGTTLKQIAADIVRSNIKRALTEQFTPGRSGGGGGGFFGGSSLFDSIGDAVIHFFGAKNGGLMTAYAGGGLIRGPGTGTSDSIPALVGGRKPIAVSNGEFVQPDRAVRHYGVQFMEAVRTLKLPRPTFAFGGLVSSYRQARFATGGMATAAPAADGGMNVRVELVNNGTPQQLVRQTSQVEGRDLVVKVMLQDLRDGGPVSQAMRNVQGRS